MTKLYHITYQDYCADGGQMPYQQWRQRISELDRELNLITDISGSVYSYNDHEGKKVWCAVGKDNTHWEFDSEMKAYDFSFEIGVKG